MFLLLVNLLVSGYVDIIAMRHPIAGSADEAVKYTEVPFINAGDGGNQHPTQTLTDLLTIKTLTGRLDNHVIGLCGDLKYGRTVHSLVKAMNRYNDSKFVFIAPEQLRMPGYVKQYLKAILTYIPNLACWKYTALLSLSTSVAISFTLGSGCITNIFSGALIMKLLGVDVEE